MHPTKAQSKTLVHSKISFKTETSSTHEIAQNSLMQHRKQNWSGEANTAKSLEISPVFFKKRIWEPIKINQNAAVTGSTDTPCVGGDVDSC